MGNNKLIRNYIYNTLYQILLLIAPLITTPYVSRVLGVTNIGIYQYVQSIASYFVLIGAVGTTLYGQREIAYLQDDPISRSKAFWEIELFRIAVTVLCTLVYVVVFCSIGQYPSIYLILSLEVLATAFDISWLYMGMEDFRRTVVRNTVIKITGIVLVFLFVKSKNDLGIYAACLTAPIIIGNLSLWLSINKYLVDIRLSLREIATGIGNRIRPIITLFLPQVAMDVYLLLDKTMLGMFASSIDEVGYYSQAQKIVKLTLTIVTSLGTVMLPTMSSAFARGDTKGIVKSIKTAFSFIYMLSFALLFGLCAIASEFVPVFFGDGYEPVSRLIVVISPILVIIATSNVIGKQYLLPTNHQTAFTISVTAGALANFILNLILIRFLNAMGASIATVLAELSVTIVQCLYVRDQLPLKECIKPAAKYCLFGGIMFCFVKLSAIVLNGNGLMTIFIMVLIGMVVYVAELFLTKDIMLGIALNYMKGLSKQS